MNRYLVKLQKLQMAVNQDAAFVSFVSPPSMLKSGDGPRKKDAFVTECFVSAQSGQLEDIKSATETDRQNRQNRSGTSRQLGPGTLTGLLRGRACGAALACAELVEPERWLQLSAMLKRFWPFGGHKPVRSAGTPRNYSACIPYLSCRPRVSDDCHATTPWDFVWLLHGRPVIALTATEAVIRATSGAMLTYRRRQPADFAEGTAA